MIRPFKYSKPRFLREALEALEKENTRALAGGSDLLVEMREGKSQPEHIVDVKAIPELSCFSIGKDGITIGGQLSLNELADSKELGQTCPILGDAVRTVATPQVRNRATLVGNLCTASPAADMAPPLFVLNAAVVVASKAGEQRIPIQRFFQGPKKNCLTPGQLVLRVEIPPCSSGRGVFMKKSRVQGHDLATINVAGWANPQDGSLRICIGACGPTPVLLTGSDELYQRAVSRDELLDGLAMLAQDQIAPIDDLRASAAYRRHLVTVFLGRMVRILFPEEGGTSRAS
ncbi:MAG: xanthine dehydrogenase family protein subunit M [Coprothermobacterota bacterium]|nr:xanthine dehydrogenase family protein subunit M [Coprothermobacterota bacterium]